MLQVQKHVTQAKGCWSYLTIVTTSPTLTALCSLHMRYFAVLPSTFELCVSLNDKLNMQDLQSLLVKVQTVKQLVITDRAIVLNRHVAQYCAENSARHSWNRHLSIVGEVGCVQQTFHVPGAVDSSTLRTAATTAQQQRIGYSNHHSSSTLLCTRRGYLVCPLERQETCPEAVLQRWPFITADFDCRACRLLTS